MPETCREEKEINILNRIVHLVEFIYEKKNVGLVVFLGTVILLIPMYERERLLKQSGRISATCQTLSTRLEISGSYIL